MRPGWEKGSDSLDCLPQRAPIVEEPLVANKDVVERICFYKYIYCGVAGLKTMLLRLLSFFMLK